MPDKDSNDEVGSKGRITRRDLIRKGAIVGGTLAWVAPAMQSLAKPAYAFILTPNVFSCCICSWNGPDICLPDKQECTDCQLACSAFPGGAVKEYRKGTGCLCGGLSGPCTGPNCDQEICP
jgi:hypothetical protein